MPEKLFLSLGKLFFILGIFFVGLGVFFIFFEKIPFLGKLPGDILIKKKNFVFFFPLGTCIFLSLLLSLIFYLFSRWR